MKTTKKNDSTQFLLRTLNRGDVPRAMKLKEAAGWNQLEADWHAFLKLNPDGCFGAERDGFVVGTGACLKFEEKVGWIAMILVDPDFRRLGFGKKIMNQCLDHLALCPSVKLDATEQGRKLYLKLGFKDEFEINRYVLKISEKRAFEIETNVSPIENDDLGAIQKLDAEAFGANRKYLVENLFLRGREFAFKFENNGNIEGFILGRRGSRIVQLGPIVAKDETIGAQLVGACLNNIGEKQAILDIPIHSECWMKYLINVEMSKQRWFMRMYRGKNVAGDLNTLLAITGPDFG